MLQTAAGLVVVTGACRIYHGRCYVLVSRQQKGEITLDDCMEDMQADGYTAVNTGVPVATKLICDGFLSYLAYSEVLLPCWNEYLSPAMSYVSDMVKATPQRLKSFVQGALKYLHGWCQYLTSLEGLPRDLCRLRDTLVDWWKQILVLLGLGVSNGKQWMTWEELLEALGGLVWKAGTLLVSIAYRVGRVLYQLLGVLFEIVSSWTAVAVGWLAKYGYWAVKNDVLATCLQLRYLSWLLVKRFEDYEEL